MRHTDARVALDRMLTEQPRRLLRRVRPMTANESDAQDVAQEIVLRALRGIDALSAGDEALVCAWLDAIARNTAYNATRGGRRRAVRSPEDADLPPQPSAERVATAQLAWRRVVAALHALPPELADVLRLRLLEDLPGPEVARRLGLSESTMRSRLHRARAQLRAAAEEA